MFSDEATVHSSKVDELADQAGEQGAIWYGKLFQHILRSVRVLPRHETEVQTLAQQFLCSVTSLGNRQNLAEEKDEQYVLVGRTTYCNAASLVWYEIYMSFHMVLYAN